MSIWVKFCKYVDFAHKLPKILIFGQNFWKYWFWRKLSKNLKFSQICPEILIWSKFKKCQFWSKYQQILILVKIIKKTSTLVEIVKNLDFGQNYKNLEKSWFLSKLSETLDFG